MSGPRLFGHTEWKSKKGLHIPRCPVFSENIGGEQKKVFVVCGEALHFLRGPRLQPA